MLDRTTPTTDDASMRASTSAGCPTNDDKRRRKVVVVTKQESFKRQIRERMSKTGERYAAARRILIEQSPSGDRLWVSEPDISEDAVQAGTGRSWDDWCDLIDEWPGSSDGHAGIASYLQSEHGVDAWWAQGITVGYERITGLRLPYQRPDGTFSAGKSRTVQVDATLLKALLLDDGNRKNLFPGQATELRSNPTSKVIRISIGPGIAQIGIETKPNDRAKVSIIHEKLPDFDDVAEWKFYWSDWLEAIDQGTA